MTCGITVAPMIPVASRMLSVPEKPGTKRCLATSPAAGLAWKSSITKEATTTPTSAVIPASSRRKPICCRARIAKAPAPAISPAGKSGMPKSRLRPSAAPTTSAMSQAIATSSACSQRPIEARRGKARGRARRGSCRWRCRASPTGSGPASRSGWPPARPRAAGSRTWRRRRCWWRSCPGRCRRRRRRRPGRGTARPGRGRGCGRRASAAPRRRPPPRRGGRPRPSPRGNLLAATPAPGGGFTRPPSLDREAQVGAGDRRAVRIVAGLAQLGGDQQLQLLGDVVLEHLGLGVDPVVGHPQRLGEVGLDQPVVADHLQRDLLAGRGQGDAPVGQVLDQAQLAEPLQHRGRGRRRDAEPLRDLAVEDRAPARSRERA